MARKVDDGMKPSPGIMLIWRFAAAEAERSSHEFIEPEHFVEAMTRGESLTDDTRETSSVDDERVTVLAVLHTARHDREWRRRV